MNDSTKSLGGGDLAPQARIKAARLRSILERDLREARPGLHAVRFTTGEMLLREGDAPDAGFFILDGAARVFRISARGDLVVLAHRRENEFLGELGALDGGRRSGCAVALEPTHAIAIARSELLHRMETDATFADAVALQLCLRVREATERAFALAAMPVAARLAAELLRAARTGQTGKTLQIGSPPSVTDLAARINATRESVSKTLSKWQTEGILERGEDVLFVRQPHRLSAELDV